VNSGVADNTAVPIGVSGSSDSATLTAPSSVPTGPASDRIAAGISSLPVASARSTTARSSAVKGSIGATGTGAVGVFAADVASVIAVDPGT